MDNLDISTIFSALRQAVIRAGEAILEVYQREFSVEEKEDKSPLTEADKRAHEVLAAALAELTPEIPVLSEEGGNHDFDSRRDWSRFWLVDPLDGTKEFIKKNGEFTVNVGLIVNREPIFGMVLQPTEDRLFSGGPGMGAFRQDGDAEPVSMVGGEHYLQKDLVRVVGSRSHNSPEVDQFVEELKSMGKEVDFVAAGSSLKICLVADGKADVYPRLGPTMEWDTGAAHAVALGAGRRVTDFLSQKALCYNKENLLNPWFIVE